MSKPPPWFSHASASPGDIYTAAWEELYGRQRRVATLPNCTKCGRFTSDPSARQWYEALLCPRCADGGEASA